MCLISGALLSLMMVLTVPFMDRIGFDYGMVIGYTTMVIAFLMIFFGVKAYRDNVHPDGLSFGRAFATGLLISFVATACYVATWQVVYRTMMPDYLEKYSAYTLEKKREAGASEAELSAEAKKMAEFGELYKNPLVNIAFTFLEPLPVGLVMSLVTAGALRRKAVG